MNQSEASLLIILVAWLAGMGFGGLLVMSGIFVGTHRISCRMKGGHLYGGWFHGHNWPYDPKFCWREARELKPEEYDPAYRARLETT